MDAKELVEILNFENIPNEQYSINSSYYGDVLVMQKKKNRNCVYWEIFYIDERGGENDYRCFNKEDIACKYFLYKLLESNGKLNDNFIEKYIIKDYNI